MGGGLPVPQQVEVSARIGLWVSLATHDDLAAWARVLGLTPLPRHSQPYMRDGVLCRLTHVGGRWRDTEVTLACVEPLDALAALRGDGEAGR